MTDGRDGQNKQPFIHVSGLNKWFGANHVLRGIDMSVEKGESLVILGGSGAGKSVLLRHLVGLDTADEGRVMIDGLDLARLSRKDMYQFRRRVGMSFQESALFDSLNVYDNIAFPLRRQIRGIKEDAITRRVQECLDMVGMPTVGKMMPNELSGGMRRRVGFARSIALKPELLLFDEPTTGLDPIMTSVLSDVIVSLRENLNATTVTITHDIKSARMIATKVAMLFKGQLIEQGTRDSFFESRNPIVRQFLEGESKGPVTEMLLK